MPCVKPALQKRSRETRDRLIAALDRLLRERPFEEIAVSEIAAEAGVSVGAVYRRFQNKDAFVPALFELYQARTRAMAEEQEANAAAAPQDLRGALRHALVSAHSLIVREGHLMRAVYLYARIRPELVGDEWAPLIEESRKSILQLIDAYRGEIAVADPEKAADALTYFLNVILIEDGLFGHVGPAWSFQLEGEALAEEMADFAYGYLTAPRR